MKKLFYIGALSALLLAACGGEEAAPAQTAEPVEEVKTEAPVAAEEPKAETPAAEPVQEESAEPEVPREHANALEKAKIYAQSMHMSKAGIYDQLVAEFGDQFPADAAQYAIDNLEWDWKANALEKAKIYADTMSMSNAAVYDQLIAEFGDKFTEEEAQYAVDNL